MNAIKICVVLKNLPFKREVFISRALQIRTSCTDVIKIILVLENARDGCHIAAH